MIRQRVDECGSVTLEHVQLSAPQVWGLLASLAIGTCAVLGAITSAYFKLDDRIESVREACSSDAIKEPIARLQEHDKMHDSSIDRIEQQVDRLIALFEGRQQAVNQ